MTALPLKADIGTHSRNVRFVPEADIGATLRCASKGRKSRGPLYQEIETVSFEDRFCSLRAQERQILGGIWLGGRRQRSRINDWIVRIVGKNADNLHIRLHLSIRLIDNAERSVAARDQTEG